MVSFLRGEFAPDQDELTALRMNLMHAEELVKRRIDRNYLVGNEFVAHFIQNEALACRGIDELMDRSWP